MQLILILEVLWSVMIYVLWSMISNVLWSVCSPFIRFNHFCVHHKDTFQLFLPLWLTILVHLTCFYQNILHVIIFWPCHLLVQNPSNILHFILGFVHVSSSDAKQIKLLVNLQTRPLNFSPCVLTCADTQTVEIYLSSSSSNITSFIKTLLISTPTNFWSLQFSHHPHAILCLGYPTYPALCFYNFC